MKFRVSHKGITQYSGGLSSVFDFVIRTWGSFHEASEIGVKVEALA